MVIKSNTIQKTVIEGTDENLLKFADLMKGVYPSEISKEYLDNITDGAWKYIQGLLYQGSQSVIYNIEGLLKAPDEEAMRAILTQWKGMEELSWTVEDDKE